MLKQVLKAPLRIGYIPEHFSTPIAFADRYNFFEKNGLKDYELIPHPSGSGHLISALKNDEVDIVIGLTEAFVRGISSGDDKYYKIVGEYVDSPLCWSISSGSKRDDINSIEDLKKEGKNRIGISRIGSGSYVMPFVLGLQQDFKKEFKFEVLNTFKNLRDSVNEGTTDAFMWEYFTTKKYYDSDEVKKIGAIYTPWSSWVITSSNKVAEPVITAFLKTVQEGIQYYNTHQEEAIDYILSNLDYNNREDLEEWAKRVKFVENVTEIRFQKNIVDTMEILRTAGIVAGDPNVLHERLVKGCGAAKS